MSVLVLSAADTWMLTTTLQGRAEMVEHIVENETILMWAYGSERVKQIKCEKVPLDLLEPDVAAPSDGDRCREGLLAVVDKYQRKELLQSQSMAWRLAEIKWQMFAEQSFTERRTNYLLILVIFFLRTLAPWWIFPSLLQWFPWLLQSQYLIAGHIVDFALLAFTAGRKAFTECNECQRRADYFHVGGARRIENVGSFAACVCCILWKCIHFAYYSVFLPSLQTEPSESLDGIVSIVLLVVQILGVISLWSYSLFFVLGFQSTGTLVIMFWEMCTRDILKFSAVYVLVVACFAHALFLLHQGQMPLMGLIMSLAHGENEENAVQAGSAAPLIQGVGLFAHLLLVVVMANTLVAMMNNTCNRIEEESLVSPRGKVVVGPT